MKSLVPRWPRRLLRVLLVGALLPILTLDLDSPAAADGWQNVTSNLANMQSECGNLGLLSPVPKSNTIIAGIAQQGLWASSDGGASWQPLGTGQGSARITNRPYWISYDPLNPTRFYESGSYGGGGAFATTNAGATFAQLATVTHNDLASIDYTDPDRKTLLVGGHEQLRTLWKSTDAGQSWTNIGVNLPPGTGYSSAPLIIDARTYLVNATGVGEQGIFRSTDGGLTWTRVSSLGPDGPPLVTSDGSIYWAVGEALAKSSDHGVTWSSIDGGFVNSLHPIEVPGGRLVSARSDTLVVSSDGGATWTQFGPQLPYPPAGVVYSENQKALFIWHWDCGTRVLPDAIQKLSYEFPSAPGLTASAGLATSSIDHTSVQFRANWVSPTYLAAGQSITVFQDVFADHDVNLTFSVDVLDTQGDQPVLQSSLEDQAIAAQQMTRLALTIGLPGSLPSGTYVVKTAAVGPDGNQYARSDSAGSFVVTAPPPTPTPVPGDDAVANVDQPQG
ncbi:MAG: hypothetical protein J2P17_05380 [Mycobacterium sp.]|nr:hypothetical protein [Mycobacterium sp.]